MINSKYFFKGLGCVKSFDSPAIALGCCMIAIGVLLKNIGFNLQESAFSTFLTYALPGSLVMAETMIIGGSLLNIFFAVWCGVWFERILSLQAPSQQRIVREDQHVSIV